MDYTEYIQVNLPKNEKDYIAGTGEGVWVKVDKNVKKAYNLNESIPNTHYYATLDNDSCYYQSLKCGTMVPIELRGKNRPVVPYLWLSQYKEVKLCKEE